MGVAFLPNGQLGRKLASSRAIAVASSRRLSMRLSMRGLGRRHRLKQAADCGYSSGYALALGGDESIVLRSAVSVAFFLAFSARSASCDAETIAIDR